MSETETDSDWRDRASKPVQDAVETIADASGEDPDDMVGRFEGMYGPIEDLPDEFAEEFNERAEEDVRAAMSWAAENAPGDAPGESSGPSGDGSQAVPDDSEESQEASGEVSRQEFQELQRSVRQTNQQLQELTSALENMGGSGGGDAEANPQNQIAAMIAQKALGGGQSNPMGEFGQQLAQEAMKGWVRDMQKPDLGDMIEMQMYQDMAPEFAEKYKEDLFGDVDMPEGVEEMVEGEGSGED